MSAQEALLRTRAPAKVNLTLHVLGRRQDGYHDLDSLVVFAGIADLLSFRPGGRLVLTVDGPTASGAGPAADNLVLRAARALHERRPDIELGAFHLVKRLPAAAGIGGGSSDAAAALRLLARHSGLAIDDPAVVEAARATGADIPVCLVPRARVMRGAGERVGPDLDLPALFAVLVNPGVAVPTADVFRALGLAPGDRSGTPGPAFGAVPVGEAFLAVLAGARNDLEPAALALAPAIGEALAALREAPGCRLARMSGSGATVFGLYDDCRAAGRAAKALKVRQPGWWVKPTLLR